MVSISQNEFRGCRFPDGFLYDVEYHVWVKLESDIALIGATDPGQAYAGEIIYIKVKDVGTSLERGAIAATVESAKYMGPMRAPLSGIVIEVNPLVKNQPSAINSDPYSTWVLKIRPTKADEEMKNLLRAKDAAERYKSIIEEWGIECGKS
ncbi:MAG: glycine cleavage system protein H [Nitrososphaerota archaeon]